MRQSGDDSWMTNPLGPVAWPTSHNHYGHFSVGRHFGYGSQCKTKPSLKLTKILSTKPVVLAFYDPQAPTKAPADASSYGLGATLMQKHNSWKAIAFTSRSMTET